MADKDIFCNIPWYEININHDGSYDLCGCQNDKLVGTKQGQVYNIKQIPILDYWNSERIRNARLVKLGDEPDPKCKMCQLKDKVGYQSNRVKENIKSAIFPENFDRSFKQSLGYEHFEYSKLNNGFTQTTPHSLHINLGYHCNFACRMCGPMASTKLQTEFIQLGWMSKDERFTHWTDTEQGWNNFTAFLEQSKHNIKVIHIIGGEVDFIPKFVDLLDYFIDNNLAHNINLSFNTNGSVDYTKHFPKLEKYKRCEMGVSLESIEPIGNYIRQGGDVTRIQSNLLQMKNNAPSNMQFVVRTVPSLLSLPYYANLVRWCWEHNLPIDNSVLVWPLWLRASMLDVSIKQTIINDLQKLLNDIPLNSSDTYLNQKNANAINSSIRNECNAMIKLASLPCPDDTDEQLKLCASKLSQWDALKNTNLKDYSTMLFDFLTTHGYKYEGH